MKPSLPLIAIMGLFLVACHTDSIETTEDPVETSSAASIGEDDFIERTTFNRTITITWTENSASVDGDEDGFVSINGTRVTVDSRSDTTKVVKYILSGTCPDGSFKLYSLRKQALVLKALNLTNSGGAAINNQSHKRTFVVIDGVSALYDGALNEKGDYPDAVEDEDLKAAFFSEGQLIFSGNGGLSVVSQGKSGITSDDYLRFLGTGLVSSTSYSGHAIRGKDAVQIEDGTVAASTFADGKKGISSDGPVTINGGTVRIGIHSGVLVETTDEGTELTGSAGIKSDGTFTMTGGLLDIANEGQGGKGISGDGDGFISGGTITVSAYGANYGTSSNGYGPRMAPGWPGGPGGMEGNQDSSNSKSAKGIKFDGNLTISDGIITVSSTSHEAIECKGKLTVTGGTVFAKSESDDAINSGGDMNLTGGYICGYSTGNDGLDANGDLTIDGATVYAISTKGTPEVAIDANSEGGKKLYVKSGTMIAVGGIESGSSITGSAYSTTGWTKNKWHTLYDANDNLSVSFKTPSGGSSLIVYHNGRDVTFKSNVSLDNNDTIWNGWGYLESVSGGDELSLSKYSGGGGFFR